MNEIKEKNELSQWMSTYGLITAERILERYKIRLDHELLFAAMKNPLCFYYQILKIPLKNVFNGIILQQAYDYEIYAQKLYIDYLISGETTKSEDAAGGFTREELEKERRMLVAMAENFRECEFEHKKLIASSQKALIEKATIWLNALASSAETISFQVNGIDEDQITRIFDILLVNPAITNETRINPKTAAWQPVEQLFGEQLSENLRQTFIDELVKLKALNIEIENSLSNFSESTKAMEQSLKGWRSDFYGLIIRVQSLLNSLPDYHIDLAQIEQNKESLFFDPEIGEKKES